MGTPLGARLELWALSLSYHVALETKICHNPRWLGLLLATDFQV